MSLHGLGILPESHVQTMSTAWSSASKRYWRSVSLLQEKKFAFGPGGPGFAAAQLCHLQWKTLGKAPTSLRSSFRPRIAVSDVSLTEWLSTTREDVKHSWKGLAHGWQSANFSQLYWNPLKPLPHCVQWSSTTSPAGKFQTGWLYVQHKVFPKGTRSALREIPWSFQTYWNNTTIICAAKLRCQPSIRGPGIVSGTGKHGFNLQKVAFNEQVTLKHYE